MYPQHWKVATEEGKETCPWSRQDAGDIRAHSLKMISTPQSICVCATQSMYDQRAEVVPGII